MTDTHGQVSLQGWIGVDLDGTLAKYDKWKGIEHIGEPIAPMVDRVKAWLKEGRRVKIVTARVSMGPGEDRDMAMYYIHLWCHDCIGQPLPVTHEKDFAMLQLWDDRAIQVIPNTGMRADGEP